MKLFNLVPVILGLLTLVCFAMSQPAPQLASLDTLSDTYAVYDKQGDFNSIPTFSVASPARSSDELEARQHIINTLTQQGYAYKDMIVPGKNELIVIFSLTQEVRSIDLYSDEKAYRQTAMIYKDYYQEIGPFSSTLDNPVFKGLTRKQTFNKSVQSITIWAYIFTDANSLKEVWESGASSLLGGKIGIDDLAEKALQKFPAQAKKKKG